MHLGKYITNFKIQGKPGNWNSIVSLLTFTISLAIIKSIDLIFNVD